MDDLDHHSVLDLATVGRSTGRPHIIEIWFAHRGSTIYMLSGGGNRSDWVRNLIRTPEVGVRVGSLEYAGLGRIVVDPAEDRLARNAVYAKYVARYGGDLTSWREKALPIAVDLGVPPQSEGRAVDPRIIEQPETLEGRRLRAADRWRDWRRDE